MNILKIDLVEMGQRVEKKFIKKTVHPNGKLIIFDYTDDCTFAKAWDDYTRMSRGLITDVEGNIVARPFSKFFNLNEADETKIENLPDEIPSFYEKMDGSLGITYFENDITDEISVSTRGSFTSPQAIWAMNWIRANIPKTVFKRGITYLFEIIYPQNPIIVDYRGLEMCVFLAAIDINTGIDVEIKYFPGPVVSSMNFDSIKSAIAYCDTKNAEEHEGFVIKYSNGLRVKIKGKDYIEVAYLMNCVSKLSDETRKAIWRLMQNKERLDRTLKLFERPSFKMHKIRLEEIISKYNEKYMNLYNKGMDMFKQVKDMPRKEQALYMYQHDKSMIPIVFAMVDNMDIPKTIHASLKPR